MSDKNLREAVEQLVEEWEPWVGYLADAPDVIRALRALLAEHPAEPSNDVTEDQLVDALWAWPSARAAARAVLDHFHVTRRADR